MVFIGGYITLHETALACVWTLCVHVYVECVCVTVLHHITLRCNYYTSLPNHAELVLYYPILDYIVM